MHGIEWQGNEEAEQVCDSNPMVTGADREHLRGDGPGDGQGVELLDVGAGPNAGSFNGLKDRGLVLDNSEWIVSSIFRRGKAG